MFESEIREKPTRVEVLRELEKIEISEILKNSPKRKLLLRYIVEKWLDKIPISEKDIGPDIFPPYDPENNSIRVQCTNLRKDLGNYYETQGSEDIVEIKLPAGAGYVPTVEYSKSTEIFEKIAATRAGMRQLDLFLDVPMVDAHFNAMGITIDAPDLPIAYALEGEAGMAGAVVHHLLGVRERWKLGDIRIDGIVKKGLTLDPDLVHGHIVLGAAATFRREWSIAQLHFKKAFSLDPVMVGKSLWYVFYLLATNQIDEALRNCRAKVRESGGDAIARITYGFILYLKGKFYEAYDTVWDLSIHEGRVACLQQLMMGLVSLGERKPDKALNSFEKASEFTKLEWHFLKSDVGLKGEDVESLSKRWRFRGLMAICLSQMGLHEEAVERMQFLKDMEARVGKEFIKPIEKAHGYLALGEGARAITMIRQATLRGDILGYGLECWPLFETVRSNPRYQRLIDRFSYRGKSNSEDELSR